MSSVQFNCVASCFVIGTVPALPSSFPGSSIPPTLLFTRSAAPRGGSKASVGSIMLRWREKRCLWGTPSCVTETALGAAAGERSGRTSLRNDEGCVPMDAYSSYGSGG
jgi:hypothetical protein